MRRWVHISLFLEGRVQFLAESMMHDIFNFWQYLIFVTFAQLKTREAKRSPRYGSTVSFFHLSFFSNDANSSDGWLRLKASLFVLVTSSIKVFWGEMTKHFSQLFFSLKLEASQPPTTIPPPTTETLEIITPKTVLNFLPQTTTAIQKIDKGDKGWSESKNETQKIIIYSISISIPGANKYQTGSMNEIENSEHKSTVSDNSINWTTDLDKTNEGISKNCKLFSLIWFLHFLSLSNSLRSHVPLDISQIYSFLLLHSIALLTFRCSLWYRE